MKWFYFILSHSIFISICAVAMAFQTAHLLELQVNGFVYGFIFFATLCSYNFYWILSKFSFAGVAQIPGLLKKETTGIVILLSAASGTAYCLYRSSLPAGFILTAILLTVLYSIPLLPVKFLQFTRRAGVLKTVLLAFTWCYVTAFLPIQKNYWQLDSPEIFIITRRFLFMLMLCIIFDNRDKTVDKIRGLRSLATDLSPGVLKALVYIIFATLFLSNFLFRDYGISLNQSLALQVSTVALLFVYFYAAKKRSYLFYYFFVDGMMLFSALATYVAGIL